MQAHVRYLIINSTRLPAQTHRAAGSFFKGAPVGDPRLIRIEAHRATNGDKANIMAS